MVQYTTNMAGVTWSVFCKSWSDFNMCKWNIFKMKQKCPPSNSKGATEVLSRHIRSSNYWMRLKHPAGESRIFNHLFNYLSKIFSPSQVKYPHTHVDFLQSIWIYLGSFRIFNLFSWRYSSKQHLTFIELLRLFCLSGTAVNSFLRHFSA